MPAQVRSGPPPARKVRPSPPTTAPASDTLPVLDLGTGPGYNAALLSHRYGSHRVVSRDVDPSLVAAAAEHLSATGYTPRLSVGDGAQGCPQHAP
ncbi:methyltransferase domain-containing protein [Streptomyces axinellae]|uniref:methyltransferase domain-containing protein n=1 Tax=Streptomyces axinellae TaxID=552788 RepID=UPI003CD0A0FA